MAVSVGNHSIAGTRARVDWGTDYPGTPVDVGGRSAQLAFDQNGGMPTHSYGLPFNPQMSPSGQTPQSMMPPHPSAT
jgi:hypothetical protein